VTSDYIISLGSYWKSWYC